MSRAAEALPCRSQPRGQRTTTIATDFREGGAQAIRAAYHSYGRLVYAIAYKILGDSGLAEEATQQTFLNAWRAAANFDTTRELAPWLTAIARRAAIDVYRRESARRTEPLDAVRPGDPALAIEPSTAALHDAWEVRRAVDELPADEREIVRLQHFEDLTHAEIAERLSTPIGTVKSRSFRAHKRLAALLGHLHGHPEIAGELTVCA